MRDQTEKMLTGHEYALPLRREVSAVSHIFRSQSYKLKVCLDIGFTHAGVSQYLRNLFPGFWMTVEPTEERGLMVVDDLEEGTVFTLGQNGELPFEDRQFDAVILAHGSLPSDPAACSQVIRECHRVLKTGGLFVLTVEARKRLGFANLFSRNRHITDAGGIYSEEDIFRLLRDGFDVLEFRYTCRFWVQLIRQWADRRHENGIYAFTSGWLRFLYGFARILDIPFFFTRGYQMTVCGRRKSWRGQNSRVLTHATPVSDAMLFDPRMGQQITLGKFK